jgi:hypothetical protein
MITMSLLECMNGFRGCLQILARRAAPLGCAA